MFDPTLLDLLKYCKKQTNWTQKMLSGGQEKPGEARRSQERPREARRRQERPGEARRKLNPSKKVV